MRFIHLTITLLSLLSLSCGSDKPKDYEYIFIRRGGTIDTIRRELLYNRQNDTFNIISYRTTWGDNVTEQEFKFPSKIKNDSLTGFVLLDSTIIEFEGKDYEIFKYLFDDENISDEEQLFFYSPEFGIVSFRSAWWGNYDRLTKTGDKENDRIIFYLIEMVMNDKERFFIQWN